MLTAEMDAPVAANSISAEIDILLAAHEVGLVILFKVANLMGPTSRIVQ